MAKKTSEQNAATSLDASTVAQRAYAIWQREGCPDGRAMEHWFRAEAELAAEVGTATPSATAENLKIRGGRRAGSKTGEGQFQIAGR
jgi:hypothetical protein